MRRRLPPGNVPMTTESHRRLALQLRLAAESLIGAPTPESYNTLSKMLAALKRAGLKLQAVDDATATMNLICDRFERVGKVEVSADEAEELRRALARIDGGMWRLPINLLAEAIASVEVFCTAIGA